MLACRLVGSFPLQAFPEAEPHAAIFDVLNFFQEGRSHLLLISKVVLCNLLASARPAS